MARIICTVTNDLTYDQRMIRICSSLARAGHEVLLVGRRLSRSLPLSDYAFQQKRLPCWFTAGKLFYLEYNLRLFFFLLAQKTDILNAVDLDTIMPCLLVAKMKRKLLYYDAHEYYTETPEVVRRPPIKKVWEWVARISIPAVDQAYTVGPALAQVMTQRYGIEFKTVRNVPNARYSAEKNHAHDTAIILYQGALNEGRGLESAILAMAFIDGAVLWLAGEGDLSQKLRNLVQEKGLSQKVVFHGFVRPEQLSDLTIQATLGLNLLENKGLSYYYSLANKAFDYLQCGVPAIHMDFPEYRALAREYGGVILTDNLDPQSLANTIQDVIQQPQKLAQLRIQCLNAAPLLTWEKEQQILLDLY